MLPALPPTPKCCRNSNGVYGTSRLSPMNGLTGRGVSECYLKELSFASINTMTDSNVICKIGQKYRTIQPLMLLHASRGINPLISTEITASGRINAVYASGSFIKSRPRKCKEAKVSFPIQYGNFSRHPVTSATGGNDGFTRDSPAKLMRRILETPGVHQGPACFDALSAKLVEKAGFQFCFMSGFSVSAARLALPDVGLISYGEMVDQGFQITGAVSIPVIGDGDNGYGNALNVKRTVKGYTRAGFAGIILEDQVSPKACGHTFGRKVVSRDEAVMRIKAAVDARKESSSDILIIARTDARQAISLEESLWRVQAFADAGADVLFIDALASKEEMQAFCNVAPQVPKMANMLEGGGKTPVLSPIELGEIGFKIISYPLSLLGVSIQAMQDALYALKSGRIPPPASLPSFEEIKEIIGFNDYYEEEKHYLMTGQSVVENIGSGKVTESQKGGNAFVLPSSIASDNSAQTSTSGNVEYDLQEVDAELITPYVVDESNSEYTRTPLSGIWSRSLRVKITGRDGFEKLDVRIPAGFLEGLTNIIPGVAGLNIKSMLDEAAGSLGSNLEGGKKLIDINDKIGDRIQVFLE